MFANDGRASATDVCAPLLSALAAETGAGERFCCERRIPIIFSVVRIEFTLRQLPGLVDVTLVPNVDPGALGCRPSGFGFPVCTATVSFQGLCLWR